MSNDKKVVIIGSGLGGLATGAMLAKNGYRVTVLEQGVQIGGCLQCFTRKGVKFETGMHFIGSASEGQTLNRLMKYLEIDQKVKLSPLDRHGYDVVSLGGKCYRFANGKEAFIKQMTEYFPHQHEQLEKYFNLVEQIASASSMHSLSSVQDGQEINAAEYQLRSINEVIDEVITDPLLAKVLVGNLPLYAAEKDKTPFSTHAFILDFYNQSAYRIQGGSDMVAEALVDTIHRYGGDVLNRSKVTRIICDDTHVVAVEINGKEQMACDYVVSDAHPVRTMELLADTKLIRPAFRRRINQIPQTVGVFSVYLHFKEHQVAYMNHNYFGYQQDTPWDCEHYTEETWPKGFLYMHFCADQECEKDTMQSSVADMQVPQYASTGVVLSYMQMDEVEKWKDTKVGHRGKDYENFKQRKAERLLDVLNQHFPGIRENLEAYYTSTPLTYLDYTGTERGSMYGNARDIHMGPAGRVPHRTKIPNLFLTGQNINSHGMLGVLVGSVVASSELLKKNIDFNEKE